MKQHPYFKMKLWIIDIAIVMALTFMAGVWIFSNDIITNIAGWIVLGIILYLARKVVKIVRAIWAIEDIIEKHNK